MQNFYSSLLKPLENAVASNPEGIATSPSPIKTIKVAKTLPPVVIGYISPYPTVVNVVTAHHSEWNIDLNCSGCAGFSNSIYLQLLSTRQRK